MTRGWPWRSKARHHGARGARDRGREAGHAQAPFVLELHAFAFDEHRIDQRDELAAPFARAEIDHALAQRHAHLGGRQPDAGRGVHRVDHVIDQLLQRRVECRDPRMQAGSVRARHTGRAVGASAVPRTGEPRGGARVGGGHRGIKLRERVATEALEERISQRPRHHRFARRPRRQAPHTHRCVRSPRLALPSFPGPLSEAASSTSRSVSSRPTHARPRR